MNEQIPLGQKYYTQFTVRAWEPGDGLRCSYAKNAPRSRPCGRPVAVKIGQDTRTVRAASSRHYVVCAYHLSTAITPGEMSAEAETAAREKVLAEHWDEYQQAIQEFMGPRVDEMIGTLPDGLKKLVIEALRADDDRAAGGCCET